jgi:two-component system sensor histidine kinase BaeS
VSRTVAGLTPDARHRGLDLRFESDGPAMIDADADRLGQAVANLVENASKFANSTVHVAVSSSRPDRVTIAVEDDGPGIAADDLPHVFERLYVTQAQPRRSESSTGLGLAIVRELTAAMGGTVRAASGSGALGGAVLTLEFPLAAPSAGHDGS